MIENFEFYINNEMVKKTLPNRDNAAALMARAHSRLDYVRSQKITKNTAAFIFEDIYEVLREGSQALMELKGFKPYSHEAQVAFLRDNCKLRGDLVSTFDRFRILRNKCVYGAATISIETCNEALGFAVSVLPELKKLLDSETK